MSAARRDDGGASPMSGAGASPASESDSAGDTADDLLARLLQCDEQLAELLQTASSAVCALAPDAADDTPSENKGTFEDHTQHWFSTLNVRRLYSCIGCAARASRSGACAAARASSSPHSPRRGASPSEWRGRRRGPRTCALCRDPVESLDAAPARGGLAPRGDVASRCGPPCLGRGRCVGRVPGERGRSSIT